MNAEYVIFYEDTTEQTHFRFCIDRQDVDTWVSEFKERGYKRITVFKETTT